MNNQDRRLNTTPLTDEQSELAGAFVPFAHKKAWFYKRRWPNLATEFESAAMLALVESARTFKPSRDVQFGTHFMCRFRGAMRSVIRPRFQPESHLNYVGGSDELEILNEFQSANSSDAPSLHLTRSDPKTQENREEANRWLLKLHEDHREIIRLIYLEGMEQKQISAKLGISLSWISYVHREAMARLHAERDLEAQKAG